MVRLAPTKRRGIAHHPERSRGADGKKFRGRKGSHGSLSGLTAIILAGGASSRMGCDKAYLEIDGEPQLVRLVQRLRPLFKSIIIVANAPCPRRWRGVKRVSDIFKGQGPLGGIHAGLRASSTRYNFVVACDMPFVSVELIRYLKTLSRGVDAVVPRLKKGYEPLFAVYSKECLAPLEAMLVCGERRLQEFFSKVKTRAVSEARIKRLGSPRVLFANMNTPRDLHRFLAGDFSCL